MKYSKSIFAAVLCAAVMCLAGMSSCTKAQSENQSEEQTEAQEVTTQSVEPYNAAELVPIFEAIDEATVGMDRQLGEMLSGIGALNSPAVGTAFYNDTIAINAILNSEAAQALLPKDVAFTWMPANDRGSFYVLVALKK